ncbi:MAG: His/Gly/Thr/Pro-type tRNA ligase C-terminal domain-containing protein [Terracidiphilus sp.]|nr:His/Gly/Thr/Pro-type tRNA ligase C-terminal domain-containing protein [Terracidiphilus sp.]
MNVSVRDCVFVCACVVGVCVRVCVCLFVKTRAYVRGYVHASLSEDVRVHVLCVCVCVYVRQCVSVCGSECHICVRTQVTEAHSGYAASVAGALQAAGWHVDVDASARTVPKRIRAAQLAQVCVCV